jgi:hypothetical protein
MSPGRWSALRRLGLQALADRSQSVVGRGDAEMAPERLCELGGLAIADTPGNLANGEVAVTQELGGTLHANARQMLAKRGVADLGVCALELTAGGRDTASDVVEGKVARVFGLDDGDRILEERRPEVDGGGAVSWHVRSTFPTR